MSQYITDFMSNLTQKQLILVIIALVVIILTVIFYLYKCIRSSEIEYFEEEQTNLENFEEYQPSVENFEEYQPSVENFKNNEVSVVMFHVDWCGYCTQAKPGFNKFMQSNNGKTINGHELNIKMIDCEKTPENVAMAKQFNIKGYPTFILTKNGQNTNYEGVDKTEKGFLTWVSNLLK